MSKSDKIIESEIIAHIEILKTFQEYQTNFKKSWWRRVELRYGKNLEDKKDTFINLLKWAISIQDPNVDIDKTMDMVQRLNVSGSKMTSHHQ